MMRNVMITLWGLILLALLCFQPLRAQPYPSIGGATQIYVPIAPIGNCQFGIANQLVNGNPPVLYACGNDSLWHAITSSGGGPGTVTSFSAGTLSPVFTTSVATATTTPALTFSLSTAAAHRFLGNNTGSTAAPAYVAITSGDLPAGTGTVSSIAAGTGITLTPNPIIATGTVAIADTAVTPGSYTSTNITVDQQGRITAAANGTGGSVSTVNGTTNQVTSTNPTGPTVTLSLPSPVVFPGNADIAANAQLGEPLVNSATGTTLNRLAKIVVNAGVAQLQVLTTSANDQVAAVGCVTSGAGTTGSPVIVNNGVANCLYDAATTAGDIVVPSPTTAGTMHDTGSTSASSVTGQLLGYVLATNACGSPPCLVSTLFMPNDLVAPGSGGRGGGGGGNNSFTRLTSGTNTQMAALVGNGASLASTGTGVLNANQLGGVAAAADLIRTCEIVTGDPGAGSPALADDNDTPVVCANKTGATLTITAVECYANAGSPTVTPIITGGGATSILSGALTCGTGSFATGTLNGTPTQSNNGTIDGNITTAGGTAKYIVIRITRTL